MNLIIISWLLLTMGRGGYEVGEFEATDVCSTIQSWISLSMHSCCTQLHKHIRQAVLLPRSTCIEDLFISPELQYGVYVIFCSHHRLSLLSWLFLMHHQVHELLSKHNIIMHGLSIDNVKHRLLITVCRVQPFP